jgi:predicted nucleic acid-binding protein
MIFAELVAGDAVFVDANIFTFYFQPNPTWGAACGQLLQRIENGEIDGFTSTHVLSELSHRMMTIEASARFNWPFAGIGNRLRGNPAEVRKLQSFRYAIETVFQSKVQVLIIDPPLLVTAVALSQSLGLLSNDALIVAVMNANGLTKIASHDSDLDSVPGITRYAPA